MTSSPLIDGVRFTPAAAPALETGLIGYVSCVVDGSLRLDGLTVRRTLEGRVIVSFPERTDRAGRRHPYVRPIDARARVVVERQILRALGLAGGEAP